VFPAFIALYGDKKSNEKSYKSILEALLPIRLDLVDFNFQKHYQLALSETMTQIEWLKVNELLAVGNFKEQNMKIGSHHLFDYTDFVFPVNMDFAEVSTAASLKKVDRLAHRLKK
jgi:predicted nucleotidyltransferase